MSKTPKEETDKSRIAKVNKICKAVLKLTEQDFEAIEEMGKRQAEYFSPLKMATQHRINDLGDHNLRVSQSLRELQRTIQKIKQ